MLFNANEVKNEDFTILFVDDEPNVNKSIVPIIKRAGYNVTGVTNGKDAVEAVRNGDIDIVVLDYFMPKFTGEDVVREIREFNSEVVVVLQTGYAGKKPPLETMQQLDIQGYHDKNEGVDKLLLWIATGVKVRHHIRQVKAKNDEILKNQVRLAELGRLLGGVSHNLAAPVALIRNSIDIAMSKKEELDGIIKEENINQREDCDRLSNGIMRANTIIQNQALYMVDMMNAVKRQVMGESLITAKFPIGDAIKRVLLLLDCEMKKRGAILETDIQLDESILVKGLPVDLVQVINNLILNASEAYDGKATVKLSVSEKDGKVLIAVKDNGTGIPQEVAAKLFKAPITTKENHGSGAGLYVSYNTIKNVFGGELWFETKEGEGTTFFISLPVYVPRTNPQEVTLS